MGRARARGHLGACSCLLAAACLGSVAHAGGVRDEAVSAVSDLSLLQVLSELSPREDEERRSSFKGALHVYPKTRVRYETVASALAGGRSTAAADDPLRAYRKVGEELDGGVNTVHSRHILKYVSTLKDAPKLAPGGCLYMPSDRAWREFYSHLEHPYPPMFAEMVANAFYPNCSDRSVSGVTMQRCSDGNVRSSDGCIQVKLVGMGGQVRIFATEGHIGLPYAWSRHIGRKHLAAAAGELEKGSAEDDEPTDEPSQMPLDSCNTSYGPLSEVPGNRRLSLPTRVILCIGPDRELPHGVEALVREQIRYTNEGYAGRAPFEMFGRNGPDEEKPPKTNMQIEFDLRSVEVKRDETCSTETFVDLNNAAKHNTNGIGWFTIVLVAEDETGVLGMSTFPTEKPENSPEMLVAISTCGLRRWANFSGETCDQAYSEGHTVTHEVGHALGIFHTFEGGCSEQGDQVPDTEPEAYPHYTCSSGVSCGTEDPVHNFMDYVPDRCMAGFTEHQKRRAWCVLEAYRPTLFNAALREHK